MARKHDGFVPLGELADTLPGVIPRGRAHVGASPAPLHHAEPSQSAH